MPPPHPLSPNVVAALPRRDLLLKFFSLPVSSREEITLRGASLRLSCEP